MNVAIPVKLKGILSVARIDSGILGPCASLNLSVSKCSVTFSAVSPFIDTHLWDTRDPFWGLTFSTLLFIRAAHCCEKPQLCFGLARLSSFQVYSDLAQMCEPPKPSLNYKYS